MPLSAEMSHLYQAVFRDLKNGQVQGGEKKTPLSERRSEPENSLQQLRRAPAVARLVISHSLRLGDRDHLVPILDLLGVLAALPLNERVAKLGSMPAVSKFVVRGSLGLGGGDDVVAVFGLLRVFLSLCEGSTGVILHIERIRNLSNVAL